MAMICTVCNSDNKTILWPVGQERLCNCCLLSSLNLEEAKELMPACSHEVLDEMYKRQVIL